ncbi:MAG: GNAT family N-acetyltransferase [Pseudomonadales bacterium]|nr:GNAT family N-acetyltransferase [Pseudomonadales bacterium]
MKTNIHVWHLEMTDPAKAPTAGQARPYDLQKVTTPLPELSRFLYITVGGPWRWYMRADWSWDQWRSWLARDVIETWVARVDGTPIGYFELEVQPGQTTEILYFGLIPEFIGNGYGKSLLEDAIDRAWRLGGKRVWLHTCTLDHPAALHNYQARGFRVFKEEDVEDDIPERPIQPWENANKPLPDPLDS